MSLTRISVARPVTTLMACLIVVLLGWMALSSLSVALMPAMEYPTVTVTTLYPGAGPAEMETLVTRPLERALSGVNGFERLSSRTLEGSSRIRVQFRWGMDLDAAVADMRQAIDKIRTVLPEEIDEPLIRQYDANAAPIIYLGLNGELPPTRLTQLAERTIVPRLEKLDGVARVGLRGEVQREIQIELDRAKLESLGMGVNEVLSALQKENVNQPGGHFQQGHVNMLVRSRGEFTSLEKIRQVVIRRRGTAVVRIRDVADVIDGYEELTQLTRVNGEPGIMVYVFQQSGANTIDVSDAVQETVQELNEELNNVTLTIRLDKSNFIRDSIANIRKSALWGMGLAMVVLLVFLGSLRSTLIIGVSMPLSVLATFALIYFKGFTLNIVSFGGLALGMGMLVDNSIVVLESIFRKRDEGLDPKSAAVSGTQEVAGAITASTLTTLIVFLPLLFITGIAGVLLHQLAYVVSFSLVCSLGASLTLTPVLAAYWLGRRRWSERRSEAAGFRRVLAYCAWPAIMLSSWLAQVGKHLFVPLESGYSRLLTYVLRRPGWAAFPLLLSGSIVLGLLPRVGTDFLPKTDDGRIGIVMTMAPGIHLDVLNAKTLEVEQFLQKKLPEAETISVFIGDDADDGDDWNESRFIIQLIPRQQRTLNAEEIRQRIVQELGPVPGAKVRARVYGALPIARMFSSREGDNIAVLIRGYDRRTAEDLAAAVTHQMEIIPGLNNVELQMQDERPEISIRIDHDKAALLGIHTRDITQAVETTIRGTPATVYREDGDEFQVLVRLRKTDRTGQRSLGDIGITTPSGTLVPLKNVARFEPEDSPLAIDRLDRQRILVVSATVEDRDLGTVVQELKRNLATIPVPEGFTLDVSGDYEEQQKSFVMLRNGFLLAVLLMYMIMASQFEALRDPLLILGSLPLAGIGVILVLVFWQTTLNVQSFIGLIVLAGIVVNNAIVLVDYTRQLRRAQPHVPASDLIHQAGVRRFRPIVMTTLTTVLAMLPVAFGLGEGGELQAPMARVVIGGLLSGTIMTLVAIPILLVVTSRSVSVRTQPTDPQGLESHDHPLKTQAV